MFEATVTLDGQPLRYTFVSYHPDFEDPHYAISDGDGIARFPNVKSSQVIDVIVHAQNLAVRMLDGSTASSAEKSLRYRNKKSGARLNVSPRDGSFEYFAIMDRCYDVYETVFRPVAPFSGASRREYPWGGRKGEVHKLRFKPAVDCRYPETIAPGKLAWVQPQSVTGGRPLMHIKPQKTDNRLFGTAKRPATTIPHEYAHAVHFGLMSTIDRWLLAAKYGVWITKELVKGNSATHRTNKKTVPLIAFVEAIGIFSQRFFLFAKQVRPDLSGATLRSAFVEDELSGSPALAKVMPGYVKIGTRSRSGDIKPHLTGSSTEGAVYGAIFLDLASRATLAEAVAMYLRCGSSDVGGYLGYASKQRKGAMKADLTAVAKTWKL